MTTEKKPRATALVPWSHNGKHGILVHADRFKNTWILPGGGLKLDANGGIETPSAAVVRELIEETDLIAAAVAALFTHDGNFLAHHVFRVNPSGKLKLVDLKEAPAFGLCRPDFVVDTIMCSPDYSTDGLTLSYSTKKIIGRYQTDYQQLDTTSTPTPDNAHVALTMTGGNGTTTRVQIGESVLEIATGDIVTQDVDAVVNAANEQLANGAGVCGALHKAAGARQLEKACQAIDGCPTGEARITPGFNLAARYIIHAVGPVYHSAEQERAAQLLASAYRTSLELARREGLHSIAFPSLSTGIFGFPIEQATAIALATVTRYLAEHPGLDLVRFVLLNNTRPIFEQELRRLASA